VLSRDNVRLFDMIFTWRVIHVNVNTANLHECCHVIISGYLTWYSRDVLYMVNVNTAILHECYDVMSVLSLLLFMFHSLRHYFSFMCKCKFLHFLLSRLRTLITKNLKPKSKIRNDYNTATTFFYNPAKNRDSSTPFVAGVWGQRMDVFRKTLNCLFRL
jgi:hypothetical protein